MNDDITLTNIMLLSISISFVSKDNVQNESKLARQTHLGRISNNPPQTSKMHNDLHCYDIYNSIHSYSDVDISHSKSNLLPRD